MTNELAIKILTGDVLGTSEQTHEAIKMAVKALSQPDVGDTIYRQAVLDLINADWKYEGLEIKINNLPSAQPEIIYCGECKYMMPNGRCSAFADPSIRPSASDYCSSAERKQYE